MIHQKEKVIEKYTAIFSFAVSVVLHFIVLIIAVLILKFSEENSTPPEYAVVISINMNKAEPDLNFENIRDENKSEPDVSSDKNNLLREKSLETYLSKIEDVGFDSTNLEHIYKESTLNVRMKYPAGWTYVDQQVSNKIDGITFWSIDSNFNPPPYVNIEVVEKYLFNPAKYKFKYKFKNFAGFYNEPEEMEGQVTQQIYIRTDDNEDFIIKLIVNGKGNFNRFQPVFFAMINSFRFGSSLFF